MTGPRAVVFDLDNTLVLEDAATFAALRAAAATAGDGTEALTNAVAETADDLWKRSAVFTDAHAFGIWWGEALWGDFTGDDPGQRAIRAFVPEFRRAVWRGGLSRLGRSDDALAERLAQTFIAARRSGELIDPDAEPVLRELARDHRLALLTNGAGDVQREKLARTPLGRYFAAIVISTEVGVGKPDPRLFAHALTALDVAPDDATMVGDSLLRDIEGARGAGMRTIWLDRGLWAEQGPTPDARIERLSDLRAALDALERRPVSPRATF